MRRIYNEGRVVGLSSYELYVRQLLSTNPDATPMTEREWLASTLSSNSSMILKIPKDTPKGYKDFMLPKNSTLAGATVVYGSIFQGECTFEEDPETGQTSDWASNVLSYGPLISNTVDYHPVTPGLPEDVPVSPISPSIWDDDFKNMCKNYLKIQSGLVIQPGQWNDSIHPDDTAKYLDPDFDHEAFVRILISESIDQDVILLLHGFSDSSILRGEFGYIFQNTTHKPENGDFLGPEMFPWSCPIVFALTTDIQQETSEDYQEEFDKIYNLIDETHQVLDNAILQEGSERICTDNIDLDILYTLSNKIDLIAKNTYKLNDESIQTEEGQGLLTEEGEVITGLVPNDLYSIWNNQAPLLQQPTYIVGNKGVRFYALSDAAKYSTVSGDVIIKSNDVSEVICNSINIEPIVNDIIIRPDDSDNHKIKFDVVVDGFDDDTGYDITYNIININSPEGHHTYINDTVFSIANPDIYTDKSGDVSTPWAFIENNGDLYLDNVEINLNAVIWPPIKAGKNDIIRHIGGELHLNNLVWPHKNVAAHYYRDELRMEYTTKNRPLGVVFEHDYIYRTRFLTIAISPNIIDDPDILETVATDTYVICDTDKIDDLDIQLGPVLIDYGGEWIDRGDGTSKYKLKTVDPIPLVSWETGTNFQIGRMIQAYYDGYFTLDDIMSAWHVGDSRNVDLSDIRNNPYTGEPHYAQRLKATILGFDKELLDEEINTKTRALLTLSITYSDAGNGPMAKDATSIQDMTSWRDCDRRGFCNDLFVNSLPQYIKDRVKPIKKLSSIIGGGAIMTVDSAFLFSEYEVYGNNTVSEYIGEIVYYDTIASSMRYGEGRRWLRSGVLSSQYLDPLNKTFCSINKDSGGQVICRSTDPANTAAVIQIGFCL